MSTSDFYSTDYGTDISGATYPLSASITREFFDTNHFATMRTNNETVIVDERAEHLGIPLSLQSGDTTSEGLPDYNTTDTVTSLSTVARTSADM